MSISDDSVKINRRERSAIVLILVLLVLLALATMRWGIPQEQADLQQRSLDVLRQAGLDTESIRIQFSGRDALLYDNTRSRANLEAAKALLVQVDGVRKVSFGEFSPEVADSAESPGNRPRLASQEVDSVSSVPPGTADTVENSLTGGSQQPSAEVDDTISGSAAQIATSLTPNTPLPAATAPAAASSVGTPGSAGIEGLTWRPESLAGGSSLDEQASTESKSDSQISQSYVALSNASNRSSESVGRRQAEASDTPDIRTENKIATAKSTPSVRANALATSLPAEVAPDKIVAAEKPAFFSAGSWQLTSNGFHRLGRIAASLRGNPRIRREIDIYTKDTGDPYRNGLLVQYRANTIINGLWHRGIHPSRVIIRTHIENNQVAPETPN